MPVDLTLICSSPTPGSPRALDSCRRKASQNFAAPYTEKKGGGGE